jgi:prephenate dehydrogenase
MKVAVIGVGLGGSLALRLRENNFANEFIGIDKSENHLQEALDLGIIDRAETFEEGIKSADLIIVIPVDATAKFYLKVLDLVTDQQTVMDVGSTKSGIVEAIKNHPKRNRYVAFHPMWGTENSDSKSAQKKVFREELP